MKANSSLYFLGIGGTGMASAAGLAQEAGFKVTGSDANLYPPMSVLLEQLQIPVKTPYGAKNIGDESPDMVVIANALSRGHEELEAVLSKNIPYTSFPEFLGEMILKNRQSIVVSGTHGKTTTTSMMAHVLKELGYDPGYLIGGIPKNFSKSFHLGTHQPFVVEGDEYDTAFFDKNSKFLHYHPKFLIFNNLEFDHADIFKNLEAIELQFANLVKLVPNKRNIIANCDDAGVLKFLKDRSLMTKVNLVSTQGKMDEAPIRVLATEPGPSCWKSQIATPAWGQLELKTKAIGHHNIANFAQVIGVIYRLVEEAIISQPQKAELESALASFEGVQRRLDLLWSANGVEVYEDFAHHPTAVACVLETFKKSFPDRRLIVAFEPRNATSRRNIFTDRYAEALQIADQVYIGHCPVDQRIEGTERMNTEGLAAKIGDKAQAFQDNQQLLESLVGKIKPKDAIIFMSSGSFSGIQYQLKNHLGG